MHYTTWSMIIFFLPPAYFVSWQNEFLCILLSSLYMTTEELANSIGFLAKKTWHCNSYTWQTPYDALFQNTYQLGLVSQHTLCVAEQFCFSGTLSPDWFLCKHTLEGHTLFSSHCYILSCELWGDVLLKCALSINHAVCLSKHVTLFLPKMHTVHHYSFFCSQIYST